MTSGQPATKRARYKIHVELCGMDTFYNMSVPEKLFFRLSREVIARYLGNLEIQFDSVLSRRHKFY